MMYRLSSVVQRHPLITFFVLTYALTWGTLPFGLFFAPGPLLAALIVIPITQGLYGLKELGLRIIRWRVGWYWYAVAIGLPVAAWVLTGALNAALGTPPSLGALGSFFTVLGVFALRFVTLDGPISEEPGWRGFALPRMQAERSPLVATLILGVLISIWHVPLFFFEGGLQPFQPALVVGGLLGPIAFTFVATWLFNHTGGSVLMTLVLHAAEGTARTGALWPEAAGQASLVYSLVWLAVVIGLIVFDWKMWRGPAAPETTTPQTRPPRRAAGSVAPAQR